MLPINRDLEEYLVNHSEKHDAVMDKIYRQTFLKVLNPHMIAGPLQGALLTMLSKIISPACILEIGTFTGYSAICLSKGLNEDGLLHTIEANDELKEMIVNNFTIAEVQDKIKLHIGNALDVIPTLNYKFNLVFIDGEKTEYAEYYNLVIDKVEKGGIIIADNVLWDGKVLNENTDHTTNTIKQFNNMVAMDTRVEKVMLPIRDGITLIRKK